jgi:hypothetical protein
MISSTLRRLQWGQKLLLCLPKPKIRPIHHKTILWSTFDIEFDKKFLIYSTNFSHLPPSPICNAADVKFLSQFYYKVKLMSARQSDHFFYRYYHSISLSSPKKKCLLILHAQSFESQISRTFFIYLT